MFSQRNNPYCDLLQISIANIIVILGIVNLFSKNNRSFGENKSKEMKNRLGLDIGTNSIGWAIVNSSTDENGKDALNGITAAGSRIIPMDAAILGDFDKGNSISQTKDRRLARSARRLYERSNLRRERLLRILSIVGFLPAHFLKEIDRYGKILTGKEPKLAWAKDTEGHYQFLFLKSFHEMLEDFSLRQPDLIAGNRKVPYDWTLYFLRKKALTQKVEKEELAWILLSFNQKRGYYQLRGEDEVAVGSAKTRQYFDCQTVREIIDTGQLYKGLKVLIVVLENGDKGKIFQKEIPDWVGQKKSILVTVDIDKEGKDKLDEHGERQCRFRIPTEQEWDSQWELIKAKTQNDLDRSGKTVGAFIYDTLLQDPRQKIRGKLVRTIERKYYKEELRLILDRQKDFHLELRDKELFEACLDALYPNNLSHRDLIAKKDLSYLFLEDIVFYQRPLKSKKSLIDDCPYESHQYVDKATGEVKEAAVKCIAKSHPLFQEFRLWQFLSYLRIYQREAVVDGKLVCDFDVTGYFLRNEDDYVVLFDWLRDKKEIKQDSLLKCPLFGLKNRASEYRWNYVEDRTYPMNETRFVLLSRLEKAGIGKTFLTGEREEALWHILYSVSVKEELEKALGGFAIKNGLDKERFVSAFLDTPSFKKEYGAYSAKAIRKLLSVMRLGKYWDGANIDEHTRDRIDKILTGECDEKIKSRVREKAIHLGSFSDFKGLPVWLACYVVYDRHSEAREIDKWESPADIDRYLRQFRQHSLRNPIVEQVILETLRTVRDIWVRYGTIDEVHVELGREMKNPADKRKKITQKALENEYTNLRIRALLLEFMNPELGVENVRPYSPSQQDLLRIYEEGVWDSVPDSDSEKEEMLAILKKFTESDLKKRPTHQEVKRYRLWLEQKYRSPYTGQIIPLSKLFTPAYEIEHVIPQSRYFDDSFSNKVICEAEVNKLKDRMLGYEFIQQCHGQVVQVSLGKPVKIFEVEEYERFVKEHYARNGVKMRKLLMADIPDQFIERQLNDSRYISKVIKSLLSNIVREEGEQEAISKNVIVCTGGVTDRLKKDWGVNDVWNRIILPRFDRLNELTGTKHYTTLSANGHWIPDMPLESRKGFNKKRIDHRHHAMDAIVIACADRNIVNYLNNESARGKAKISRYDLQHLLCEKVKTNDNGDYQWILNKPWPTFPQDVYDALNGIVVSFKQNLRVINKTVNFYQRYQEGKKVLARQEKGDNWAIRKSMHKATIFGEVNLRMVKTVPLKEVLRDPSRIVEKDLKRKIRELLSSNFDEKGIKRYFEENQESWRDINLKKIPVYYFTTETKDRFFATRKPLDNSFDRKKIEESVTDSGIRKILLRHLEASHNDPNEAFSPEGIERMNRDIQALNEGKEHQPICKVRWYEKADKFAVGQIGNKCKKFVEANKGTNLYFAVYEMEQVDKKTGEVVKKRGFDSIPLNVAIDRQKRGLSPAPDDTNGNPPRFVLSPNDLVYVPSPEELRNGGQIVLPLDVNRIYKMVSCTGNEAHFVPSFVSNPLIQTAELGSNNKAQRTWTGEMIKEICIPLKVDRLGNVQF